MSGYGLPLIRGDAVFDKENILQPPGLSEEKELGNVQISWMTKKISMVMVDWQKVCLLREKK
jgi:hypothetical protein